MLDHGERAVGEMFRGAVQTAAHHYLAETNGRAVGYIDCGTFDRCTVYVRRGTRRADHRRHDRGGDGVDRVRDRPPAAGKGLRPA
jgi:hypothetical protein